MTQTYFNNCLVFVNEAFTGDISTATAVPVGATSKLEITGWSLTVTGNTLVCPLSLEDSSGTPRIFAATRIPAIGVGETGETWQVSGIRLMTAKNKTLTVKGGTGSAILDGVIFCRVRPVSSI